MHFREDLQKRLQKLKKQQLKIKIRPQSIAPQPEEKTFPNVFTDALERYDPVSVRHKPEYSTSDATLPACMR
jgi:hypothetical protein